jgi:predicted MPP superfamily phosphohydrolase
VYTTLVREEQFRWIARLGVALAAAAAVWFFLINRIVIHWVDGPRKTAVMDLLALGLAAGAAVSVWRTPRATWTRVWLAVLALFAVGEMRRGWLRRAYQADSIIRSEVWHPVTTTDLAVRTFVLPVAGLNAARVRVLHLSDLHVMGGFEGYTDHVGQQMRALDPDLIVMTGDYLSRADRLPLLASWLKQLPRARYGVYAVLGNHDYWSGNPDGVRAALAQAGVRVLGGACTSVDVATAAAVLRVCGTEAPWGPDYAATVEGDPSVEPTATLVLTHTPDNVYVHHEQGVTAMFAGHTHGGQFRLPFVGAIVVPSRYGRRFDEGHFVVEGAHLFVSAGVGADEPPLRLWCPPELVVVDLVGSPPTMTATQHGPT